MLSVGMSGAEPVRQLAADRYRAACRALRSSRRPTLTPSEALLWRLPVPFENDSRLVSMTTPIFNLSFSEL